MDKAILLKELSEVRDGLQNAKEKLKEILSSPVWLQGIVSERDDTVRILRELNETINELTDIQKNVLIKLK